MGHGVTLDNFPDISTNKRYLEMPTFSSILILDHIQQMSGPPGTKPPALFNPDYRSSRFASEKVQ
jgi:hypothetical protein